MSSPLTSVESTQAFLASLASLPPDQNAYASLLDALALTNAPPLGAWWDRFIAANLALWAVCLLLALVVLAAKVSTRGAFWLYRTSSELGTGRTILVPNTTMCFALWLVPVSVLQLSYSALYLRDDFYGHRTTRIATLTIGPADLCLWCAVAAEVHGLACAAKLSASPVRMRWLHRCPAYLFNALFVAVQLAGCVAIAAVYGVLAQSWLHSNALFDADVLGPVIVARDTWRAGDGFNMAVALGVLQRLQEISPELYKIQDHLEALSSLVASLFAVAAVLFVPLGIFHSIQLRQQIREARGRQLGSIESGHVVTLQKATAGGAGGLIGAVRRRWTSLVLEVAALSVTTMAMAVVCLFQANAWKTAVSDPASASVFMVDHLVFGGASLVVLALMGYRTWSPIVASIRHAAPASGSASRASDGLDDDVYDLAGVLRALRTRDTRLPAPTKDPYPTFAVPLDDRGASASVDAAGAHTSSATAFAWTGRSPWAPLGDGDDKSDKDGEAGLAVIVSKEVVRTVD